MMKNVFYLIISFVLISSIACKRTTDPTPVPIVDADLKGAATLYDEGTARLNSDGMTVAIEESIPMNAAITNINGEFILQDVLFGTYTLVYSKEGYGTYKMFGVENQNVGYTNIVPEVPALGQRSSTAVTELTTEIDGNNIIVTVTTDPASTINDPRYIRLFYDDQFNVSNTNYGYFSDIVTIRENPFEMIITNTNLNDMGYDSGTTVFLKVYGDSFYSNAYDDPMLGYRVFPNLNNTAAPAVSIVVP